MCQAPSESGHTAWIQKPRALFPPSLRIGESMTEGATAPLTKAKGTACSWSQRESELTYTLTQGKLVSGWDWAIEVGGTRRGSCT